MRMSRNFFCVLSVLATTHASAISFDNNFGVNGVVQLNGRLHSVETTTSGDKFFTATATADRVLSLQRFLPNGALDNTFVMEAGLATETVAGFHVSYQQVLASPDNSVYLLRSFQADNLQSPPKTKIYHLTATGQLDHTFGGSGTVALTFTSKSLLRQTSGRLLLQGSNSPFSPVRILAFQPNGQVDDTFGTNGTLEVPGLRSFSVESRLDSQDRLLLSARADRTLATLRTVRYLPSGTPDTSFGNQGLFDYTYADGFPEAISTQVNDNKIFIATFVDIRSPQGSQLPPELRLLKLDETGAFVPIFGETGIVTSADASYYLSGDLIPFGKDDVAVFSNAATGTAINYFSASGVQIDHGQREGMQFVAATSLDSAAFIFGVNTPGDTSQVEKILVP